jgi:hypothetical protein
MHYLKYSHFFARRERLVPSGNSANARDSGGLARRCPTAGSNSVLNRAHVMQPIPITLNGSWMLDFFLTDEHK